MIAIHEKFPEGVEEISHDQGVIRKGLAAPDADADGIIDQLDNCVLIASCLGDMDGDGDVDGKDLALVVAVQNEGFFLSCRL